MEEHLTSMIRTITDNNGTKYTFQIKEDMSIVAIDHGANVRIAGKVIDDCGRYLFGWTEWPSVEAANRAINKMEDIGLFDDTFIGQAFEKFTREPKENENAG